MSRSSKSGRLSRASFPRPKQDSESDVESQPLSINQPDEPEKQKLLPQTPASTTPAPSFDSYKFFVIFPSIFFTAFILGVNYSLSVLVDPLRDYRPGWNSHAAVIGQSLMVASSGISCAFMGRYVDKIGAQKLGLLSSVCASGGFCLIAISIQFDLQWLFYIPWVTVVGFGIGVANMVTVNLALKWNPTIRGFAGGFFGTSLGSGSVALSQLLPLIQKQENVYIAYYSIAASLFGILTVWYAFSHFPVVAAPTSTSPPVVPMTRTEMMKLKNFWFLFIAFVCGLTPGWGFVSQFPDIFKSCMQVEDDRADLLTTIIIVNYTAGRIICGFISDFIGRRRSYFLFIGGQCVIYAILPVCFKHVPILGCALFFIAVLFFSGVKATYGAFSFDLFGPANGSTGIGLLLVGYGVAGLIGSNVGSQMYSEFGDYYYYFYVMSFVAFLGLVSTWMIKPNQPN